MGGKHLEKEKLIVTSNFSFSRSVFERFVLQTRKNQGLFGEGLTSGFEKKRCVSAGVRKPGTPTRVTDRHDIILAVEMALNFNTNKLISFFNDGFTMSPSNGKKTFCKLRKVSTLLQTAQSAVKSFRY